jgi:D-methionine transport system ATP-binding protein
VQLVHGGIDTIQDEPVGTLFLRLEGSNAGAVHRATQFLQQRGAQMEVLGHVADHA